MPASSTRTSSLRLVGVVSFGALVLCLGGTGRGDPPTWSWSDRAGGDPNLGPAQRYRVATQCGNCHRPGYTDKAAYGTPLIKFNEFEEWRDRDKHSYAFQALSTPRGQEMGRLLGVNVTKEAACLNCHAPGYRSPAAQDLAKAEGVSCFACHSSFENDSWYAAHSDLIEKWRDKPADVKESKFGLLAVRTPLRRSEVCASCHVGNAREGKVLTHDMYAAGHPPLPSFEVAVYSKTIAEPPHWWQPQDVEAFKDADQQILDNFQADLSGLHLTKMALIGEAVALREAMDVMAKQAEMAKKPMSTAWPELAHFECYACHHDLKAPGYLQSRQVRGYGHVLATRALRGQAGRPHFRPWPMALVRLAIYHVGGGTAMQKQFDDALKDLYTTCDEQPFGDPGAVSEAAAKLAKLADDLVAKLAAKGVAQKDMPGLLRELVSLPPGVEPDVDTARQIAWAFDVIYSEWDKQGLNEDQIRELKRIFDRMRLRLKLDPFFTRKQWADAAGTPEAPKTRQELSQYDLEQYLSRAAEFSPSVFKSDLLKLLQWLSAAGTR